MKKKLLLGFAAFLLFLDVLALDDITTGNEPSLTGEYLIVVASVPVLLAIALLLLGARSDKKELRARTRTILEQTMKRLK